MIVQPAGQVLIVRMMSMNVQLPHAGMEDHAKIHKEHFNAVVETDLLGIYVKMVLIGVHQIHVSTVFVKIKLEVINASVPLHSGETNASTHLLDLMSVHINSSALCPHPQTTTHLISPWQP